jgi:polyisoprenyl-phosphate glycosyltransferase
LSVENDEFKNLVCIFENNTMQQNRDEKLILSIVSPVYNAENIIDELIKQIEESVLSITKNYELILVDDCGKDNSWLKIEEQCKNNSCIKGIKLSRNFGQHHAITAGLAHATGEWIIVMDCDLQDKPSEIINLYNYVLEKKADIVLASRKNRQDSFLKKTTSKLFYQVFQYLSEMKFDGTTANFGIYNHKVIKAVLKMNEPMRSFPSMINWVGFKQEVLEVHHQDRYEGKSTYTYKKLIQLASNIIIAYSDKPLKLTIKLGFILSTSAFIIAIIYSINYFLGKITLSGFASLIISIWFLSGLTILILGVLALYISKIFESVKNRPLFIIDKIIN